MTVRKRRLMPARPAMVPTATMSVATGPEPTPATPGKGASVYGAQAVVEHRRP